MILNLRIEEPPVSHYTCQAILHCFFEPKLSSKNCQTFLFILNQICFILFFLFRNPKCSCCFFLLHHFQLIQRLVQAEFLKGYFSYFSYFCVFSEFRNCSSWSFSKCYRVETNLIFGSRTNNALR